MCSLFLLLWLRYTVLFFFFSSRRRHTRCALVTGVQTCALPIYLLLHRDYDPARGARVNAMLDQVRKAVAVVHPPEWNRFAHAFSHIFAGGYAAGYYSYLWAELLSADAFEIFAHADIPGGGATAFRREILAAGEIGRAHV